MTTTRHQSGSLRAANCTLGAVKLLCVSSLATLLTVGCASMSKEDTGAAAAAAPSATASAQRAAPAAAPQPAVTPSSAAQPVEAAKTIAKAEATAAVQAAQPALQAPAMPAAKVEPMPAAKVAPMPEPKAVVQEVAKPIVQDTAKAAVQQVKPAVQEVAKPVVEVAKPVVEAAKPIAEAVKPVAEVAKPAVEAAKPVVEAAKPVAEIAKPVVPEAPKPEPVAVAKPEPSPEPAALSASEAKELPVRINAWRIDRGYAPLEGPVVLSSATVQIGNGELATQVWVVLSSNKLLVHGFADIANVRGKSGIRINDGALIPFSEIVNGTTAVVKGDYLSALSNGGKISVTMGLFPSLSKNPEQHTAVIPADDLKAAIPRYQRFLN